MTFSILVTGGCGFIGSNFIRHYLENSSDSMVVNVDAMLEGSNSRNAVDIDKTRYSFKKLNIASTRIDALVRKSDIIVNFAAESHVDRSIKNPKSFLYNNVIGTFNLLQSVRKHDKVLVHISTDEIYGTAYGTTSFKETDRLCPSNPYSASKASADLYVQAFVHTYGIHSCILRCTNNFGPYQFPEKFIPKTIIRAVLGKPIPIYGDGGQERDWTYVKDFCRAISAVIRSNNSGKIYNVSSYNIRKNIEVAKKILNILGKPESLIKMVEDRPGHDTRYNIDSSRIRSDLNWKPEVSFDDALQQTVKWYVDNSKWWERMVDRNTLAETPWK